MMKIKKTLLIGILIIISLSINVFADKYVFWENVEDDGGPFHTSNIPLIETILEGWGGRNSEMEYPSLSINGVSSLILDGVGDESIKTYYTIGGEKTAGQDKVWYSMQSSQNYILRSDGYGFPIEDGCDVDAGFRYNGIYYDCFDAPGGLQRHQCNNRSCVCDGSWVQLKIYSIDEGGNWIFTSAYSDKWLTKPDPTGTGQNCAVVDVGGVTRTFLNDDPYTSDLFNSELDELYISHTSPADVLCTDIPQMNYPGQTGSKKMAWIDEADPLVWCCQANEQINNLGRCVPAPSISSSRSVDTHSTTHDKWALPWYTDSTNQGWWDCDGTDGPDQWCDNICEEQDYMISGEAETAPHGEYSADDIINNRGECCGDDLNERYEFFEKYTTSSASGWYVDSGSGSACCNTYTDCVTGTTCVAKGDYATIGSGDDRIATCHCSNDGKWLDCDGDEDRCTSVDTSCSGGVDNWGGCGLHWVATGEDDDIGEYNTQGHGATSCCGDDDGEEYETRHCLSTGDVFCVSDTDDEACCADDDCVYNGDCYDAGDGTLWAHQAHDIGGNGRADASCQKTADYARWVECDHNKGWCGYCDDEVGLDLPNCIGEDCWVAEGEPAATSTFGDYTDGQTECCGDDAGEYFVTSNFADSTASNHPWHTEYSLEDADDGDIADHAGEGYITKACCDAASDCVWNGICYPTGSSMDTGYPDNTRIQCHYTGSKGMWLDCDGDTGFHCGKAGGSNICGFGSGKAIESGESLTHGGYVDGITDGVECCSDDDDENYETRLVYSTAANNVWTVDHGASASDKACCDNPGDCVFDGNCVSAKYRFTGIGTGDDQIITCFRDGNSQWLDCDGDEDRCTNNPGTETKAGCGLKWIPTGDGDIGEYSKQGHGTESCCGDDAGEEYETRHCLSTGDVFCVSDTDDEACCADDDCVYNGDCYDAGDGTLWAHQAHDISGNGRADASCQMTNSDYARWVECDHNEDWCGYCDNEVGLDFPDCDGNGCWVAEGEPAATSTFGDYTDGQTECCGDDLNENYEKRQVRKDAYHVAWNALDTDKACCNNPNDCVYNGVCYSRTELVESAVLVNLAGGIDQKVLCTNGPNQWFDMDGGGVQCGEADLNWIESGETGVGEYDLDTDGGDGTTECCGDDAGEEYNTNDAYSNSIFIGWADETQMVCCDANDCVDSDGNCHSSTSGFLNFGDSPYLQTTLNSGGNDDKSFCYSGGGVGPEKGAGWLDCDNYYISWCNPNCDNWKSGTGCVLADGNTPDPDWGIENNICGKGSGVKSGEKYPTATAHGEYTVAKINENDLDCCGDDLNEIYNTRNCRTVINEGDGNSCLDNANDNACCNAVKDCVWNGGCHTSVNDGKDSTSMWKEDPTDPNNNMICIHDSNVYDCDHGESVCESSNYCGYTGKWMAEGETAIFGEYGDGFGSQIDTGVAVMAGAFFECCGDDAGEEEESRQVRKNAGYEWTSFDNDVDDKACCDNTNDCVYNGECYHPSTAGLTDNKITLDLGGGSSEVATCDAAGSWHDCDFNSVSCTHSTFCNFDSSRWVADGMGTTIFGEYNNGVGESDSGKECCGDDEDEHYIENPGLGTEACCNSETACVDSTGTCQDGTEICDGMDNDCDGLVDEDLVCCGNSDTDTDASHLITYGVSLDSPDEVCDEGTILNGEPGHCSADCSVAPITRCDDSSDCITSDECCYRPSQYEQGYCISSINDLSPDQILNSDNADTDSCLCQVSRADKTLGANCIINGNAPCWDTYLDKCCGNDDDTETWAQTQHSDNFLSDLLIKGVCVNSVWLNRDLYALTYYPMWVVN
jgi:hypothetical protein